MDVDTSSFRVESRVLLPSVCGACGYSWKNLIEPRCPKCTEVVKEGEVVIAGLSVKNRNRKFEDERSWRMSALTIGLGIFGAGFLNWIVHGFAPVFLIVLVFVGCFLFVMSRFVQAAFERRGFPPGIVRISEAGYTHGAGSRCGRLRSWPKHVRFIVMLGNNHCTRIRAIRMIGLIAISDLFFVEAPLSGEQVEGIVERITKWLPKTTKIRRMDLTARVGFPVISRPDERAG